MANLKIDAHQRYQNELLADISPQLVSFLKREAFSGRIVETDRLYSTMLHDWDVLQKDATDMEHEVVSLDWTVQPYTRKGEEPDAKAHEVAKVVEEALWKQTPLASTTAYSRTFPQLIGGIVHALFRGYNVHEIVWASDGELIYPARYIQLPAQFLAWEDRMGKPDRLLLVRDGEGATPEPFPARKFIIALNTSGPDHPIYNAAFFSLVSWFCAFKFGLGWTMEFCQRYGIPWRIFYAGDAKDRARLENLLASDEVLNTVILDEGRTPPQVVPPPTSAGMPQKDLVAMAESACHKLILGQTLTSDTSQNGGSLAQASVHSSIQVKQVLLRAQFVADVLNEQLIPAIVEANYGTLDGIPLPTITCKSPAAQANTARAEYWAKVLSIPGMAVLKSEVYDDLGIAMPAEGDETLKAPEAGAGAHGAAMPDLAALMGQPADTTEPTEQPALPPHEDELAQAARSTTDSHNKKTTTKRKPDPAQIWLEPLKQKLREARKNGASLSDLRELMRSWRPDTAALATALADSNLRALQGTPANPSPQNNLTA